MLKSKGGEVLLGSHKILQKIGQGLLKITAPLRDLLKKDATSVWTPSCQQAFDYLKDRPTSTRILTLPNFDLPFTVHCDASLSHIGFALTQLLPDCTERVVTYGSRALTPSEQKYTIFELETHRDLSGQTRIPR